jgi:hypothetical protein
MIRYADRSVEHSSVMICYKVLKVGRKGSVLMMREIKGEMEGVSQEG